MNRFDVQCDKCGRWYDDETRQAECPHDEIGRPRFRMLIATAVLALSGCAGPGGLIVNADLDSAIGLAKGANDAKAVACFETLQKANTSGVVGVFGMIEQVRIFKASRTVCADVLILP